MRVRQFNKDTVLRSIAASSNTLFRKKIAAFNLANNMHEALEYYGHYATGKLKNSIRVRAGVRKFSKGFNSVSNIYPLNVKMAGYGEDLDKGFKVEGKTFGEHYKAIMRWAKAKQSVPSDPVFVGKVTSKHIAGQEIGGTGWFEGVFRKESAVRRFIDEDSYDYFSVQEIATPAGEAVWREIYRAFPKVIGITK